MPSAIAVEHPESEETPSPEQQAQTPERPAWLPEKFKTPEDMAKAYGELERKQSSPKPKAEEKPAEEKPTEQKPSGLGIKPAEKPTEQPETDLDLTPYYARVAEEGKLRDEDYAELKKVGFSKSMVDTHIAGVQAQMELRAHRVYSEVGGQEAYAEMQTWAAQNLSHEELEVYNRAVNASDQATVDFAVKGLMQRWRSEVGPAALIQGSGKGGSAVTPFKSVSEMRRAMSDERYQSDEAYRKEVEDRLRVSNIF